MSSTTIIGALLDPTPYAAGSAASECMSASAAGLPQDEFGRVFKIRGADSAGQRSSANVLIRKRYEWRGYGAPLLAPSQSAHRITLTATDRGETIGTITVALDSGGRLQAEDAFGDEVAALRRAGLRLCEFTKLAVDTQSASRRVLASLFHVAYLLAHRIKGHDTLVIEVNPRHVAYYRRLLGCSIIGAERCNQRVNAPAVLLKLDMDYAREQISRLAGRLGPDAENHRTLYPLFFSESEETGIISRLQREYW